MNPAVLPRRFAERTAAAVAVLGLGSLAAGLAGRWNVLSLGADYIPVAPVTAALFLLLAGALAARLRRVGSQAVANVGLAITGLTAVVAGLVAAQALGSFALPWDDWPPNGPRLAGAIPLGRMSPLTAVAFLFSAAAFAAQDRRLAGRHPAVPWS